MGILTNPDRDMVAETFSATVIESFEERLKNEFIRLRKAKFR